MAALVSRLAAALQLACLPESALATTQAIALGYIASILVHLWVNSHLFGSA